MEYLTTGEYWNAFFYIQTRGWQTFSVKKKIVNIFGSAGHMVFVATTQLSCSSVKVASDDTHMNEYSFVSINSVLKQDHVWT